MIREPMHAAVGSGQREIRRTIARRKLNHRFVPTEQRLGNAANHGDSGREQTPQHGTMPF